MTFIRELLSKSKEITTWAQIDSKLVERDDDIIQRRNLLTIPNNKNWETTNEKLRPIGVRNWNDNNAGNDNNFSSSNTSIAG